MEENTQAAEATISEEVVELEVAHEDDIDTIKAQLESEREAKKQILARAKAAEQKLKSAKASPAQSEEEIETYIDLRTQGYDREDIGFIRKNGGVAALKDENSLVSIALRAKREKQEALRESSKVGGGSPTSEVERRFSPEELAAMPLDELYKVLPKSGN